ncbi:hypothetical protein CERSUDRAFT_98161 [Gelatoporia subvermispora B]|uniref:BTB domain-containing protein n=1 Tax=Ceriporiopsis subvermispora (strain B) TaxID=914234 RepID=M2Q9P9_CERS8|nr:hypothetical protein CERSUDRAFT_98161 [Gelatoporia subvermispora B]
MFCALPSSNLSALQMDVSLQPESPLSTGLVGESARRIPNNAKRNAKKKMKKGKGEDESPVMPIFDAHFVAVDAILDRLPSTANKTQVIQAAHNHLITGGIFVDTKVYCFSRRWSSGRVDKPLPLYANSIALRHASQYFQALLSGAFREGGITNLSAGYPCASSEFVYDYDYESDSDLDEQEGKDPDLETEPVATQPCDNEQAPAEETLDDLAGPSDTSTCVADAAVALPSSPSPGNISSSAPMSQVTDVSALNMPPSELQVFGKGRTICVQDIAYKTWQALIFYIYFGEVKFAPLKSQGVTTPEPQDAWSAPLCSPKSMYRLADKYGLEDLRKQALDNIRSRLSSRNIWTELLSRFTSRYPEVQGVQVDFVLRNSSYPARDVQDWVKLVAKGDVPHSSTVLATLMVKLLDRGKFISLSYRYS